MATSLDPSSPGPMLSVRACLLLSQLFRSGPLARYGTHKVEHTTSVESMMAERVATVPTYYSLFRSFCRFQDQTVVELGCSRGYLLAALLEQEPFQAIGVDRDGVALAAGRAQHGERIRFVQSDTASIPIPDASCDVAYTVDTVEHLSEPEAIFREIHRILRPGGRFLIHFHPWYGPYGAHLSEIIPFPWPHVLFSMHTLLAAAAIRYESPDYIRPFYHRDRTTNPYHEAYDYYLNPEMTIRGFRRMLRRLPFSVMHERRIGFGGKGAPLARHLRPLARVPGLDELFTSAVFCVCQKPGGDGL